MKFIGSLLLLVSVLITSFSVNADDTVVSDVSTIMQGNCLSSYNDKYANKKEHKAFTYARGDKGQQACNWWYGKSTAESAKVAALKSCNKNRKKRKIKNDCEVIDVDSNIVVKKGVLPAVAIPDYKTPVGVEYDALHDNAMRILEGGNCQRMFRKYLTYKNFKAFAYTTSEKGFYGVCTFNDRYFPDIAEKEALERCNKRRLKSIYSKTNTPECKIFAINNTIVLSREDLGLAPFKMNLLRAAERMSVRATTEILDSGEDIEQVDKKGNTPLLLAIKSKRVEMVKYLIEKGANINSTSKYKKTPLDIALKTKKNTKVVRLLKNKGAKRHKELLKINQALRSEKWHKLLYTATLFILTVNYLL